MTFERPKLSDFVSEPNSQSGVSAAGAMARVAAGILDDYKRSKQQQQPPQIQGATAHESLAVAMLGASMPGLGLAADMARTAHEETFGREGQQG